MFATTAAEWTQNWSRRAGTRIWVHKDWTKGPEFLARGTASGGGVGRERNSSASGLTVKEWASLNVVRPGEQYIGLTLTLKASLILGENAVGECASWVLTWLCRPNGAF